MRQSLKKKTARGEQILVEKGDKDNSRFLIRNLRKTGGGAELRYCKKENPVNLQLRI